MHELTVVDFPSKELGPNRAGTSRVGDALRKFLESGSFESAQKLCVSAIPTSEFYSSQCLADGSWIATIRFDNLLHDGEGPTEVAALVDVVARVCDVINMYPQDG